VLVSRLGFQLADGGREVSGEDGRVRPLRVGERGRCHVLGARVQRRRDGARICPYSPSPVAGEDLVGPSAEQERIGALVDLGEERAIEAERAHHDVADRADLLLLAAHAGQQQELVALGLGRLGETLGEADRAGVGERVGKALGEHRADRAAPAGPQRRAAGCGPAQPSCFVVSSTFFRSSGASWSGRL
jgi:hypothetical protein